MADAPEDQKVGTADQQEQNPTTKTQTPEVGGDTGGETGQKSGEDEGFDALPQKTQDEIKSLRAESASWRKKFREMEEKVSTLKSPEEMESALAEYRTTIAQMEDDALRSKIARKHKLPEKWAKRLSGKTAEEYEADAKEIAADLVHDADADDDREPRGGLNPGQSASSEFDPVKLAAAVRRR